jgi:hypothetical protein
VVKAELRRSFL